jgi:hypothetical protein
MPNPSNTTRNTLLTAVSLIAFAAAGCGQQSDKDAAAPPAAPYGAAASPNASAPPVAVAEAPVAAAPVENTHTPDDGHGHAPGEDHDHAPAAPDAAPPGPPPAGGGSLVGAAPFAGMAAPTNPLTPTPDLDSAIAAADKGTDKKAIAAAYAARGTFRMNDEKAGARVKYRAALEDYRKSLKADPANAEAKTNKKMIEDIYRSMGRPVPGEDGK